MLISDHDEKLYYLCLLSDIAPLYLEYFCIAQRFFNSVLQHLCRQFFHGIYTNWIPTKEVTMAEGLSNQDVHHPYSNTAVFKSCVAVLFDLTNLQRGTSHTTQRGAVQDKATLTRRLTFYKGIKKTPPAQSFWVWWLFFGFAINANYLLCQDSRNHQNMFMTNHSGSTFKFAKLGPFSSSLFQLPYIHFKLHYIA